MRWTCPIRILAMLLLLAMVTIGAAPLLAAGTGVHLEHHQSEELGPVPVVSGCGDHTSGIAPGACCGSVCCAPLIPPPSANEATCGPFTPRPPKAASLGAGLAPEISPPPPKTV